MDAVTHALPFGKHADEDVRDLVDADRNYAYWLMGRVLFRERHPALYSALRRRLAKRLAAEVAEENNRAARARLPASERYKVVSAADLCDASDLV